MRSRRVRRELGCWLWHNPLRRRLFTRQQIRPSTSIMTWLDLNHDGTNDFRLSVRYASTPSFSYQALGVFGMQSGNKVRGLHSRKSFYASRLPVGVRVGPKGEVSNGNMAFMSVFTLSTSKRSYRYRGPWAKGQSTTAGYLGFRFVIKGKVHYGWARLRVKEQRGFPGTTARLTGYAYETVPNKTIITGKTKSPDDNNQPAPASLKTHTPEPAMLGVLALGAPGLSIWKRKESVAATTERN